MILETLKQITTNFWMAIYLRILAIIMAYGASVHIANLLGFGEMPWQEMPIAWRMGDIIYGILDVVTAWGLWQRTTWGIVCFFSAIASQLLIYTVFIDYFASNNQQRQTIFGLVGTELILILIFGILFITKK